ncbi:hypothetical protein [Oceanivirga miroungae]|uniref:Uncharacterized protein n=1 Tax=Oceanivirga miroungae TaxID=1130046 RepID=A0A6I8M4W5_9FUSO|nr:hypothetical protein [Oceanivirga miroungae]VWL84956.1 hypothetical protein OMES3154_00228 [Oceanivirga miroungae]
MIKEKDVVTLYMPFPSINSNLAVKAHMYICYKALNKNKKLLKVQTNKAKVLKKFVNYHIENNDINRNPFLRPSIIDLDKLFIIDNIVIPISLKTKSRGDISQDLYEELNSKMKSSIKIENVNETEFLKINKKCFK